MPSMVFKNNTDWESWYDRADLDNGFLNIFNSLFSLLVSWSVDGFPALLGDCRHFYVNILYKKIINFNQFLSLKGGFSLFPRNHSYFYACYLLQLAPTRGPIYIGNSCNFHGSTFLTSSFFVIFEWKQLLLSVIPGNLSYFYVSYFTISCPNSWEYIYWEHMQFSWQHILLFCLFCDFWVKTITNNDVLVTLVIYVFVKISSIFSN